MDEFNFTQQEYEAIINNVVFNEKKQEKVIFEMLVKGYTIKDISNTIGVCERTIYRRKNNLLKKLNIFINDKEILKKSYCVYIHKFPNNKVYIGMTNDVKMRWQNGLGYQQNKKMFEDILNFGWNNIEHNIIKNKLSYYEALKIENEKILEYNSYDEKYGYNIKVSK